ncbi:MAG TPA: cobalamin B12-binding domain-containing protein [Pseudonocardiaceae bacterium]|nr:cobalamin B12-binding domain-containing protein [Pseudonocardiaceae bacterium]
MVGQTSSGGQLGRTPRIRVVMAKPGLDGHDRGVKVVARALRDAGVEVVYTGLHQTPEQIVETALQEDADAIGLSVLSGAHMTLFSKVVELLAAQGAEDVVVFGGGIIPDDDIPKLEELGVARVFTPGATTQEIVAWVHGRFGIENTESTVDSAASADRPAAQPVDVGGVEA